MLGGDAASLPLSHHGCQPHQGCAPPPHQDLGALAAPSILATWHCCHPRESWLMFSGTSLSVRSRVAMNAKSEGKRPNATDSARLGHECKIRWRGCGAVRFCSVAKRSAIACTLFALNHWCKVGMINVTLGGKNS